MEGCGGRGGGHPGSVPHLLLPTYFLILLVQVFQKRVQLILVNEATSILDNEGRTSAGGRTQAP